MARETQKQLFVCLAILAYLLLTYGALLALRTHLTLPTPATFNRLVFFLAAYCAPLVIGWMSFGKWPALTLGILAALATTLIALIVQRGALLGLWPLYALAVLIPVKFQQRSEAMLRHMEVDVEKGTGEKNELELALRERNEQMNALLSQYNDFYNLRGIAERCATSLSLSYLADQLIRQALDFVRKGEMGLLYLVDTERNQLSLVATAQRGSEEHSKQKQGDLFDAWALKNRQRLLVEDVRNDFRFTLKKGGVDERVASLMSAPVLHESRVIGIVRMQSSAPHTFETADLRDLDVIAGIASSALVNAQLFQRTEELSIRDSLTALFVQRYFLERLEEEHGRTLLTKQPLSLLMCDLDHFKSYNDRYGHAAGDLILQQVALLLQKTAGQTAFVSRYGGEEFALLLPKTDEAQARERAEAIRETIEQFTFKLRRMETRTTISIGVATCPQDALEPGTLLRLADERLYQAKRSGRNQVCASA